MADTKEYKDLFKQSGVPKRLLVSFPDLSVTLQNEDIVSESMEISESLCSGSELRFGSCEASVFKLRIIGNVIPLIGATCVVSMYARDIAEPFVLGTYKVASDKPTADRRYRDIVAYDAMYDIINADVAAWYNSILPNEDSTTTLRAFRDSFMEQFGMEQEEITLPNDEMVVERTIEPEVISGKDVLTAICELNGCFGHIGRNGKMQYIFLREIVTGLYPMDELYPSDDLFPRDNSGTEKILQQHYISCKYEDYTTKRIGKLQIRQEENDIGCIIGEGENCYIVQDNFLVYGKDAAGLEAVGQRLFDIIGIVWYRPTTVKAIGNPCLEVGSGIRMITQHEIVESYILERTLKGIQGLIDNYEAQGAETYSENVNGMQRDIIQLKGKTNTLIRTVDEMRSTIEDVEAGLHSEITQTADAIRLEVEDLRTNTSSSITQLANQISLRVTEGEVESMINIALGEVTITADQINLDGYVSAGGGNFTIDESGNLKIVNNYHTIEVGDTGIEVYAVNGITSLDTVYGSGIWFRESLSTKARIMLQTDGTGAATGNLNINVYDGTLLVNGSKVATTSDILTNTNQITGDFRTGSNGTYVALANSSGNQYLATTEWVINYVASKLGG